MSSILELSYVSDAVADVLVLGYKMGIGEHSGACANNLGALYYMDRFVEQNYKAAAELYETAASWGCFQSVINLGYIYEYGRTGDPDYAKAFEYYALAAALTGNSEALYKLGDTYSRGKSVPVDKDRAMTLWEESLDKANSPEEVAQLAIRIANEIWDEDPLRALALYQQAEIGLRIDIDNDQTYYKKRLKEAIEGQKKARKLLDLDVEE